MQYKEIMKNYNKKNERLKELDDFCNNFNKIYNKNDIKISLIKILRQNYNNTIHIIDIINKEDL